MKAKSLLGLREKTSLKEIKNKYKNLMKKWHPDKHSDNYEQATQMSMEINDAYQTILDYCNSFEYPLDEESVKKSTYTPAEWWNDKFGTKKDTI
ncbi:J domain-containing protein [Sulfurimonas sp.]|uniref:J domain-containing protein n=1 Tax=Sulfurimonas sp. TaxID=2022749 RepID=UPI00262E9DCF|nr:J domain-containing protein [Sulfurimonas sp.]